jgi:hypothetical protein
MLKTRLNNHQRLFLTISTLLISFQLFAQSDVKIGTNPGNKNASAVLELESTSKGFILPRMTAAQMGAIATPANGLMVYNTDQQCAFIYRGSTWVSLCDSATNGLTKTGSVISLGGALTGATTITTTGANTLALAGLQGGASTDSIMTLDAATGVIRRRTVADVLANAGNTWLVGGNTLTTNGTIGSNSAHDVGIETNGVTRLTFTSAGAITQAAGGGQVTFTGNVDATNGLDVTGAALTANAGSTLTGTTNVNATGAGATNIGNASSTTTVLGPTNINTTGTSATTIGNATSTVNIVGNDLNVTGLQSGASTDSIMTVTNAGDVRRRTVADVVGGSITADNGLTKNTATNVRLGGTLVQATSIAQAGFDLNFSGGSVAIGSTSAPTSTMQLTGSMGISYRKVTTNTTLAATDYIVLANANAGAVTLTLPTASTCTGRIYYIGKTDEGTNAVNFSPAIYLTETTTISSINFAKKYKIVSDGTNWWIYSE